MWMEYACRSLYFSSSAPNDSPRHERLATPERKKCKLRHARLIACGVNPTFHSQNFTSGHSLAQIGWCEVLWGPCNNKHHCKRIGVIWTSGDIHFQPFAFLKKSAKKSGQPSPPKKGGVNAPLLKYTFEVTQRLLYIDITLLQKNKWVWGQGCEWGAGFVPFPCQIS